MNRKQRKANDRRKAYVKAKNIRNNNTKKIAKRMENMFKEMQRLLAFGVMKTQMGVKPSEREQEVIDQHFNRDNKETIYD